MIPSLSKENFWRHFRCNDFAYVITKCCIYATFAQKLNDSYIIRCIKNFNFNILKKRKDRKIKIVKAFNPVQQKFSS